MRLLDGGGSMCTRVVTRHPCPEREWRIIDCSKDHRLVCRIQPRGSQLEVYVHLLKSGLPMSPHLSPSVIGRGNIRISADENGKLAPSSILRVFD